ncbi:unnamed protein product [Echinostoma caproni]|uniref:Uncharacterized protein n=1 Tax=Echinostoma caproni TaxID=27848 RepID=A0A3P8EE66_9TREM|nr:unnamed protein product [Echinostoma caproni]
MKNRKHLDGPDPELPEESTPSKEGADPTGEENERKKKKKSSKKVAKVK